MIRSYNRVIGVGEELFLVIFIFEVCTLFSEVALRHSLFGVLQSIQINFHEKIIGVKFISGPTPCSFFGPELNNCNYTTLCFAYYSLDF